MSNNKCPICQSGREKIFRAKLLQKHEVDYFFCQNCGFLQTEKPYWLEEAYQNAIASTDTGLVVRNITISKKLTCILYYLFEKNGKYLDIAGGYGLLTRLMRDVGFDFYWSDLYCQNIFANYFEASNTNNAFSAVTAFEVLEHLYDPVEFISKSLESTECKTLIFSTQLFDGLPPAPNDWWYYAHETGQHISFFQHKTLDFLAKQMSLNFYSTSNYGLHILTDQTINNQLFKILSGRLSKLLYEYISKRMKSKLFSDRDIILKQISTK